jgi:hypothetical protein
MPTARLSIGLDPHFTSTIMAQHGKQWTAWRTMENNGMITLYADGLVGLPERLARDASLAQVPKHPINCKTKETAPKAD